MIADEVDPADGWRARAACAGTDLQLWFPTAKLGAHAQAARLGAQYCRRCPVIADCAADTLACSDRTGIRAGILIGVNDTRRPSATATAVLTAIAGGRATA